MSITFPLAVNTTVFPVSRDDIWLAYHVLSISNRAADSGGEPWDWRSGAA